MDRGKGMVLAACIALALTGCDRTTDAARETVTETVTRQVVAPQPAPEPLFDKQQCDSFIAMRDANKRLARDGYADDYSAEYDQHLRAGGCIP